jgi:hypothetical protein
MSPNEFLAFAQRLADAQDSGAAGYRSAISRAYYCAYLTAREWFESRLSIKCKSRELSEHELIQRCLMYCQVPEAAALGHWLNNLHEDRKLADYVMDDTDSEDQQTAQRCAAKVDQFLMQLAACTTTATIKKIKAGIIQYRKKAQV